MIRTIFMRTVFFVTAVLSFSQTKSLSLIKEHGNTLSEKITAPPYFSRIKTEKESFADYLQKHPLEDSKNLVFLSQKNEKRSIDFIIRLYSEYLHTPKNENKIKFHYSNGYISEWKNWKKDFRINVAGSLSKWTKFEKPADEKLAFEDFLKDVFLYTDARSIQEFESTPVTFDALDIGDILLDSTGDGQACIVLDSCINSKTGEKAFLLAQRFSSSGHLQIQTNPNRINDPWFYKDDFRFPFKTTEYIYPSENWRRLKI